MTGLPARMGLLSAGLVLLLAGTVSTSWWTVDTGTVSGSMGLRYAETQDGEIVSHESHVHGRNAGWIWVGGTAWFGGLATSVLLGLLLFQSLGDSRTVSMRRVARIGIILSIFAFLTGFAFVVVVPVPKVILGLVATPGLAMVSFFLGAVISCLGCLDSLLAVRAGDVPGVPVTAGTRGPSGRVRRWQPERYRGSASLQVPTPKPIPAPQPPSTVRAQVASCASVRSGAIVAHAR